MLFRSPGQSFRIGQTVFQLVSIEYLEGPSGSGSRLEEQSFAPEALRKFRFNNAEQRLEILTKFPDAIEKTRTDEELAQEAIKILLKAIPYAKLAACIQYPPNPAPDDKPLLMRFATKNDDEGRVTPSKRLMTAAINRGEGMLHVWQETDESNPAFTFSGGLDWAFCMPLKGEACRGWGLYVSGQFGSPGSKIGRAHV